jgi:DNA-binding response OmpR family regulator
MTRGITILLGDRDETLRRWLHEEGAKHQWVIEVAEPGDDVIRACGQGQFDLVLTDLLLPGIDGERVLSSIRRLQPTCAVIVVTSEGCTEGAISLLRHGAVDYHRKPVSQQRLSEAVHRVISGEARESLACCMVGAGKAVLSFKSSDLEGQQALFLAAKRLFAITDIDERTRLKLVLAVQEAVTNAHEHGNLELESRWKEEVGPCGTDTFSRMKRERLADPRYGDRRILMTIAYDGPRLEIRVQDEGSGFTKGDVATSEGSEMPLSSGRGLTIIRGTMDEVYHSPSGNEIVMVKYLDRVAEE